MNCQSSVKGTRRSDAKRSDGSMVLVIGENKPRKCVTRGVRKHKAQTESVDISVMSTTVNNRLDSK